MKNDYRKITKIYYLLNILIFGIVFFVYTFLSFKELAIYSLCSVVVLSLILLFKNKIPEIFSILFSLFNLVTYSLFFVFVTKSVSGVELYPMVLTGVCYLLTFELKKPKWVCPVFATFSGTVCVLIIVLFKQPILRDNGISDSFYFYHELFTSLIIVFGLLMLSISYELLLRSKNRKEKRQREELLYIANHDPLTGLNNRRRIWDHLHFCESQKAEENINYVISIFDIDSFKRVNDTYSHSCGDFILVEISKLIKDNLSKDVKIGRWGGEEFLLLYKGYKDEDAVKEIEKLRKLVSETDFDYLGTKIHITLTFGVSSSVYCDSAEHIIIDADKQLMKGKIQGKNRVVVRGMKKDFSENDAIFDSLIDTPHKD